MRPRECLEVARSCYPGVTRNVPRGLPASATPPERNRRALQQQRVHPRTVRGRGPSQFSFDPEDLSLPFRFPKGLLDASKHIRSKVEADGSDRRDVELDVDLAPDGAGTRTEGTGRVR